LDARDDESHGGLDLVNDRPPDRAQVQIVLHGLEGGLDLDELDIEPPQFRRLPPGEIGAQQIAAFAPPPAGATATSTRRQAARAMARAAPSFMIKLQRRPGVLKNRSGGRIA
jgi:hypothetical protein